MRNFLRYISLGALMSVSVTLSAVETNPPAVSDLLNRIGGAGTADRFVTIVDESLAVNGKETFVLTSADGKPCVKGSTLSALTSGLGWYLNHTAGVNLSWNNLTTDLSAIEFPLPQQETHTSAADYRYYLNYCTFSYSMSTWTWERWQQEIDWMALHGINMPLQIIGLEEVWRRLLTEDYGYTAKEANDFIGGPGFMAWFGMNNLQGWGGPNPDWWYARQAEMGRKMSARMRELGIEPVLPGFAGMVPDNFQKKNGIAATSQGGWCGFTRPYILDATTSKFPDVAAKYYARLKEVMGESKYYSIDPFHEGGATPSNVDKAYKNLYNAMDKASPGSHFVIQSWQWSGDQYKSLDNIPKGKLLVLDLYSDGRPGWGNYKGHETVYCTIFNFGGRTGLFGRFNRIIDGYFEARETASVLGIGAAPEAIEQTPVMYDLLFELPWLSEKPDAARWMAEYAARRYHAESPEAAEAWELLRTSALDCQSQLQGPHEAIVCSRPALTVNKVSTWGSAEIFYDRTLPVRAAYKLYDANLQGENYSYDLADVSRQALTDYAKSLLDGIRQAHAAGNTALFNQRRDAFLELILDLDRLLSTNSLLTLGHWTERARAMADEGEGTTAADADWLELDNARTLISTWGPQGAAEGGGLRDYSYREWGGMLRDFYYQRWKTWFDNGMQAPNGGWFQWEWNWAHSNPGTYSSEAQGDTRAAVGELMPKYLSRFTPRQLGAGETLQPYFIDRLLSTDATGKFFDCASPGALYSPDIEGAEVAEIAVDFSRNGRYEANETQSGSAFMMPDNAPVGERMCRITLTDGTVFTFTLKSIVKITEPRTVSVATADAKQGSVSIDGTDALSVTGTDPVICRATSFDEYDFNHWTDAAGNYAGNDNPMTYYGLENASFTAHFAVNKWGVPPTDGYADKSTVMAKKQYISLMSFTQNGETKEIYSTSSAPERQFVQIPTRIKAAPGGEFTLEWADAGGLSDLKPSAFVDLNGDGTFELNPATELLAVGNGTLHVLLPYSTAPGTTHLRLRFDSPSNVADRDEEAGCMRPDGLTDRFVYELLLEVVDSPDYACTVTYAPNDDAYGSMRSENETMVYNSGEEVVITAFPAAGCIVKRWVDNHGRELPAQWIADNGLSVNFKAFDNAHITAEFEPLPIQVSGWSFGWEGMAGGKARLNRIIERGDSHLDLSMTTPAVGSIVPGLFADCGNLTEVTLPEGELTADGAQIFSAKITGDGTRNKITNLSTAIAGTDSWVMIIEGTATSGASFDDYGSGLYGNGTDCLAENFSGGWSQIFLKKDGTVSVKWDSADAVIFSGVKVSGKFTIRGEYDASAKQLRMTVTSNGNSQTQTLTNSSEMKEISRFATALPRGIDITLTFRKPDASVVPGTLFAGVPSIMDFHCIEGSKVYSEKDGVIYKPKSTRVWAYPEGRLSRPFTLKKSTAYVVADPADDADLTVTSVSSPENPYAALWALENGHMVHANSGLYLSADGSAVDASGAEFGYELVYGSGMPSFKLTAGKKTLTFKFEPLTEILVKSFPAAMTLPVNIEVPSGVKVGYLTGIDPEKGAVYVEFLAGDVIAASMPFVVISAESAEAKLPVVGGEAGGVNFETIASGVLARRANQQPAFVSFGARFVKSAEWPANSIVVPVSVVPASLGDSFAFDLTADGLTEISISGNAPLFDILGRPVRNPSRGLYITPSGKRLIR